MAEEQGTEKRRSRSPLQENLLEEEGQGKRQKSESRLVTSSDPMNAAFEIFLHYDGFQLLENNDLDSVARVNRAFQNAAHNDMQRRCQEQFPSFYQLLLDERRDKEKDKHNKDEKTNAVVTWQKWQRFRLDEDVSRNVLGSPRPAEDIDIDVIRQDIDVLLHVTKASELVWHGVSKITLDNDDNARCVFSDLPHYSFEAPLFEASNYGEMEFMTLYKALDSSYVQNGVPPLSFRIVLRRRSNGKMTTLFSQCHPYSFIDHWFEHRTSFLGFRVKYQNHSELSPTSSPTIVKAILYTDFYCSKIIRNDNHHQDTIRFTTQEPVVLCKPHCTWNLSFETRFPRLGAGHDPLVAAMQHWYWE